MTTMDTVIVGAGQAGLGTSFFLQQANHAHFVFERGRVGESWISQRWDSFQLNTLNSMNTLPGLPYDGPEPDGFWRATELVEYFQGYVEQFHLPVQPGVNVISVEKDGDGFITRTTHDGNDERSVRSRSVVIASGIQNAPKFPPARARIPRDITQLHTSEYRNAAALSPGAVVIVGSGQSGCQIAEELLSAGRNVYLCTGKVGRVPRRYRGRDVLEWWIESKFLDVPLASLEDKSISRAAQPHISGLGRHGHTLSLQNLAARGVAILGHLLDVEGNTLIFSGEAAENVRFADAFSQRFKETTDSLIAKTGIPLPPLEEDPADEPDPRAECVSPLRQLNLPDAKVGTIIWATGFKPDFNWLHLPVFDEHGQPAHQRGISPVRGLYFIGFPWLTSRKSGIIYGISDDAHYISEAISDQ